MIIVEPVAGVALADRHADFVRRVAAEMACVEAGARGAGAAAAPWPAIETAEGTVVCRVSGRAMLFVATLIDAGEFFSELATALDVEAARPRARAPAPTFAGADTRAGLATETAVVETCNYTRHATRRIIDVSAFYDARPYGGLLSSARDGFAFCWVAAPMPLAARAGVWSDELAEIALVSVVADERSVAADERAVVADGRVALPPGVSVAAGVAPWAAADPADDWVDAARDAASSEWQRRAREPPAKIQPGGRDAPPTWALRVALDWRGKVRFGIAVARSGAVAVVPALWFSRFPSPQIGIKIVADSDSDIDSDAAADAVVDAVVDAPEGEATSERCFACRLPPASAVWARSAPAHRRLFDRQVLVCDMCAGVWTSGRAPAGSSRARLAGSQSARLAAAAACGGDLGEVFAALALVAAARATRIDLGIGRVAYELRHPAGAFAPLLVVDHIVDVARRELAPMFAAGARVVTGVRVLE